MLHVNPATMRKRDLPGKTETNTRCGLLNLKIGFFTLGRPLGKIASWLLLDAEAEIDVLLANRLSRFRSTWTKCLSQEGRLSPA
jgi:hypothetical protein